MKVPDNKAAVTCKPGTSYGSFLGPGLYSRKGCELIYVPSWLLFNKMETVCPHGNWSPLLFRKVRDVIPPSQEIEAAMEIVQQHEQRSLEFFYVTLASAPGFFFVQDSTPNGTSHRVLTAISPKVLASGDTHPQQLLRMTCMCLIVIPSLFH